MIIHLERWRVIDAGGVTSAGCINASTTVGREPHHRDRQRRCGLNEIHRVLAEQEVPQLVIDGAASAEQDPLTRGLVLSGAGLPSSSRTC
jgi:hypothetical protein